MSRHFHTWFPKAPSTCFVVKNIAPFGKRIKIFNYPIVNGGTRDLLSIPEISEATIRHSLLKGELRQKAICREIEVVCSDIDLLQFNDEHKAFLESIGIMDGLEVEVDVNVDADVPYLFRQGVELLGSKNGTNRTFTTPESFINGTFENNEFHIIVYHNGRTLINGCDYVVSESGGPGSGFDTLTFITFVPNSRSELYADYVIEAP